MFVVGSIKYHLEGKKKKVPYAVILLVDILDGL